MDAESGEVGLVDANGAFGGVWRARLLAGVFGIVLGSCLRVVTRAKGRRSMKAMMKRLRKS